MATLEALLQQSVAEWCIRYRKRKHVTQLELANKLGWTQSMVARLERGERVPRLATLKHLSSTLGVRFKISINVDDHNVRIIAR